MICMPCLEDGDDALLLLHDWLSSMSVGSFGSCEITRLMEVLSGTPECLIALCFLLDYSN